MENDKGNARGKEDYRYSSFLTLFHKRPVAGCDIYCVLVAEFMELVRCGTGAWSVITVDKDAGGLVWEELRHFLGNVGARHV